MTSFIPFADIAVLPLDVHAKLFPGSKNFCDLRCNMTPSPPRSLIPMKMEAIAIMSRD